jgi:hypothetical protein
MSAAIESTRESICTMCNRTVLIRSMTTRDANAPEMLATGTRWVGFVAGDTGPEFILTCSDECTRKLLFK